MRALPFLFEFWAMSHQLPPPGDWRSWVVIGGRGAGKTRAGAEWVRHQVEGARPGDPGRAMRVALVGETYDQVRDVMVRGDSGILHCSPPDRRPQWRASERRLVWPNGAEAQAFSASDPDGLRGPQFDAAWVDELGCPAVDKGTNQPNKFVDPKSSESSLPRFSNGQRDDLIQGQYLRAQLGHWEVPQNNPLSEVYGGPMIDLANAYAWAWDTRPFPAFPGTPELWADGENYRRGHWLNGRVGARTLRSVVEEICARAGLTAVDASELHGTVRGYLVEDVADARAALQPLMLRYGFDAIERDGILLFRLRDGRGAVSLDRDLLARADELEGDVERQRAAEAEITGRIRLRFVESGADYRILAEEAVLPDESTHAVSSSEIPLAMTRAEGRQVVERWLAESRLARDTARFALPPSQMALGAGDIVALPDDRGAGRALYRIDRVEQTESRLVEAVRIDPALYTPAEMQEDAVTLSAFAAPVPVLPLFLDLPLMTGDEVPHAPHLAVSAQPWPGTVALYASASDDSYALSSIIAARATVGVTETALPAAPPGLWDEGEALQVRLISGSLESREAEAVLNGANVMAIGDGSPGGWELIQFREAELIAPDTYWLRGRLRGQAGSDGVMPGAWPAGSWVVLMDGVPAQIELTSAQRRIARHYRIGPARRGVDDPSYEHIVAAFDGNGLRPYAPGHLVLTRTSGGAIAASWIRRTRIDGDSWDLSEVPLGEESELYLVRVREGGTILRQESVTAPGWSYPVADQTADGLGPEAIIEVAQISARFGPGPFTSAEVPA
uniref:baseplate multidomain protein megatron n=1 Tax=Albibacillus kandeliae TaxID=2174228 RepID=UPI000D69324E